MVKRIILVVLGITMFGMSAYGQLPSPESRRIGSAAVTAQDLALTVQARQALQTRLRHAVVMVTARMPKQHDLALSGRVFDGAAVAIQASYVAEVLGERFEGAIEKPQTNQPRTNSIFNADSARASSPFADRSPKAAVQTAKVQYYLTTADWLTLAESIAITIDGKTVDARVVHRDESQNLCILSTARQSFLSPVDVMDAIPENDTLPALVYLLLSPGTRHESLTQHILTVSDDHAYGLSNHTARNGYALFDARGVLVGLSVGPAPTHTQSTIVHPGLFDRALHPKRYQRVQKEVIDTIDYTQQKAVPEANAETK